MKNPCAGYHFSCAAPSMEVQLEVEDYLEQYSNPFDAFYVLETMDIGVTVLDPSSLNFLYVNSKAIKFLGFEKHEILGRSYLELIPERYLETRRIARDALDAVGHYGWMDINLITKDLSEVPVKFKGRYVTYKGRRVILSVLQWRTKRPLRIFQKSVDTFWKDIDAMIINELDFEAEWLMDNLPIGVGVATPDGAVRYVNKTHAAMLGYIPCEMLDKPNLSFIHQESARDPKILGNFMRVLTYGMVDWHHVKANHKDGSPVCGYVKTTLEKFNGVNCVVGLFEYIDDPEHLC